MKRVIELKHVGPKEHVRQVIEELIGHLEQKLRHFREEATSIHVLFEENGTHKLYRTSLTCHIPGHMVVAHEERRDSGEAIREAFAELGRQLDKHIARLRRTHLRKRNARGTRAAKAAQPLNLLSFNVSEQSGEPADG